MVCNNCSRETELIFDIRDLGRFYLCRCGNADTQPVKNSNPQAYSMPLKRLMGFALRNRKPRAAQQAHETVQQP